MLTAAARLRLRIQLMGALLTGLAAFAAVNVAAEEGNGSSRPESSATSHRNAARTLTDLRDSMKQARAQGHWTAYRAAALGQKELLHGSPRSRVEVARAEAQLGNREAALSELRVFARMGQGPGMIDSLPELASLRGSRGFAAIHAQASANARPLARASLAFRLRERELLPEDIDFDADGGLFYITSVLQKKIVTATLRGELAEFARSPDGWPLFALRIDTKRGILWASEVALEGFQRLDTSAQGRSALLCFELRSRKLIGRIEGPRPSALGDMALLPDGTVIVSDGEHGGVYRLRPGANQLERIDRGDFISPQTVATAADEAHLFVPDYLRGIGILSTDTGEVKWLPMGDRHALHGVDGLYRRGNRLIAVQNGTDPERVVVFSLDAGSTNVVAEDIVERSTPTLGDPTHGVIVGEDFYFIANSGWDTLDDSGNLKAGMTLTEPLVMKFRLRTQRNTASRRSR